jgi:hypothetical protein
MKINSSTSVEVSVKEHSLTYRTHACGYIFINNTNLEGIST